MLSEVPRTDGRSNAEQLELFPEIAARAKLRSELARRARWWLPGSEGSEERASGASTPEPVPISIEASMRGETAGRRCAK